MKILNLRNISVRARLYLTMVIVTVSLSGMGLWSFSETRSGTTRTAALFDQANTAAGQVAQLREAIGNVRRLEANIVAIGSSNSVEVERLIGLWKVQIESAKSASQQLAAADAGNAELDKLVQTQQAQLSEYGAALNPILLQLQNAAIDGNVALAYASKADPIVQGMVGSSDAILKVQTQTLASIREEMASSATVVATWRLVLVVATLVVVVPLMWLTIKTVCDPIEEAVQAAHRIAGGDLSLALNVEGRDETARLLQSLQAMQESLRALVGQVRDSADSIQVASSEVAQGNQDLSVRTEQTASNLQQTASSVDQLTGMVTQSADSARRSNELASSAAEVARRGGDVVSRVVTTMEQISASSERITDIIGVIDSIAFQTNILALNAAVEAARAGEQGRGFAVVASEVRLLAQRSADAAKEIKGLISESVQQSHDSARLVTEAGSTMNEIVSSVQRVSDTLGEISSAANEQSTGISQVNRAVTDLDQATQQNAALVEQSAAAAESLRQHATALTSVVARFRLTSA